VPCDAARGRSPSVDGSASRSLRVASVRIPCRRDSSYWARAGDRLMTAGYDDTVTIPCWQRGVSARHHAVITPSWRSVRVGVCGHDLGRNAATLGDVETVVPGPFTNRLGIAGRALGGRLACGPACG